MWPKWVTFCSFYCYNKCFRNNDLHSKLMGGRWWWWVEFYNLCLFEELDMATVPSVIYVVAVIPFDCYRVATSADCFIWLCFDPVESILSSFLSFYSGFFTEAIYSKWFDKHCEMICRYNNRNFYNRATRLCWASARLLTICLVHALSALDRSTISVFDFYFLQPSRMCFLSWPMSWKLT